MHTGTLRPQAQAMLAAIAEPGLHIVPGCGDGMGARLIREAGFRFAFASGSSVSAMRLAMPDMDLLTFPEMRDAVESIVAAAPDLFWVADGDTGYGNAISLQKTIRAYARAGASAVLIEDKLWPRPLGRAGAKLVVEREEAIARCRTAAATCREEGILLLARTDARTSRGFEEAMTRLRAFVAEGADIYFLDSPADEAEMRASVEACAGKPMISVTAPGGRHFMPSDAELERIGIKMAFYPQEILAASVLAVRNVLAALRRGEKAPMANPAELADAIRSAAYLALDESLANG